MPAQKTGSFDLKLQTQLDEILRYMTKSNVPASATASGKPGQIAFDSGYVYVCVATDTWKRAALSSW